MGLVKIDQIRLAGSEIPATSNGYLARSSNTWSAVVEEKPRRSKPTQSGRRSRDRRELRSPNPSIKLRLPRIDPIMPGWRNWQTRWT